MHPISTPVDTEVDLKDGELEKSPDCLIGPYVSSHLELVHLISRVLLLQGKHCRIAALIYVLTAIFDAFD